MDYNGIDSMINNYFEHEYRASHIVYTHEDYGHHIHLGDISSALDQEFLQRENILTGSPPTT